MKKATFMSALLSVLLCLPTSILAVKNDKFDTAVGNPEQIPKTPPQQIIKIADSKFKIIDSSKIKAQLQEKAVAANVLRYSAKANSVTDITGEYVLTYKALNSTSSDSGIGVTIETDTDNPNGVKFVNFFDVGIIVKGTVDITKQTVTIPNQVVYEHPTEGTFDICAVGVDSNGNPIAERDKPIEGKINSDGSISISTWWGMFVKEGASAGNNAGLFQNTTLERANATMSQTAMITDRPFTYQTTAYNVLATQSAPNVLTIKNFANYGQTVEFLLNSDNTATIYSQAAMKDSNIGTLMTNSILYDKLTGELKSLTGDIRTETAVNKKIINWTDWTLANQTSYTYIFTKGSITLPFDVNYPQQTASDFKGEGTEDSPYLIESPEHLILLSQKVNSIKESDYNATSEDGSRFARVFLGKYFRMTADIDMQNYRFTPIGNDWYHHFAGTFDGNGHKIKGLNISTRDEGYAALFGRCDTLSVISNLTIESPVVRTQGYYAASVAGWTLGTLDNCHVLNADIISEGRVAGSLAATARIVKNCTTSNGKVTCFGGHLGGLIGQVTELITNSNATDMTVIGYSPEELFPVGGLTGSLYKAKAEKCYFSGIVDTRIYQAENLQVGGIAGFCQGEIAQCFSVGTVNGYKSGTRTGGIVGSLFGKITDSYSAGAVYNPESEYTGGLIGYATVYSDDKGNAAQPEVKNCYTTAAVSASVFLYNNDTGTRETIGIIEKNTTPTLQNIFFDRKITNFNSKQFGTSTELLTKATGITGFDASIWTFSEGQYPRLVGIDENEAAYMSASVIDMGKNSNLKKLSNNAILKPLGNTEYLIYKDGTFGKTGNFCSIEENTLTVSEKFGTDTIAIRNGNVQYLFEANIMPIKFEGEGSEENPLLLKTKDDLKILAELTTNQGQTFANTFFKLANDIDMQHDTEFIGICTNENSYDNMFAGTLDGGGFAIHNLYINGVVWKTEPTDGLTQGGNPDRYESVSYKGLIGRLDPLGTVKNLSIAADAQLLFFGTSAPIVAYNYGTVENCRNYAEVVGLNSYIGGIVGRNQKGGKIIGCYNAGNVTTGNGNVGGISGSAEGIIENCVNVGDVAAKSISLYVKPGDRGLKFAGGIVGMGGTLSGSVIRNCVNAGAVFAEYSNAGGIVGAYKKISNTDGDGRNDMENSINFGTINSGNPELTGSLGGEAGTEGTISNNFWDNQIIPIKAIGNSDLVGMTGVETSALISGTPLNGFDTELWDFTAGQYPILKQFADEEKLAKARKVIVTMKPGVTAKDMNQNAKLAVEDGLKWSMEKGDAFAVAGSNLYSPEEVDHLVVDNLIADFGEYVKKIELRRIPDVPLAGSGTSEDPYLISTTDDWNNLSDYMQTISETFQNKYVTVAADIDFTDKEFKMLASDNITLWQGNLNGDGKTISGIKLEANDKGYGAIRSIGEFGLVSNLTIAGDIASSYAETGGFSSYVYGNISNCVNKVNVTSTKGDRTSGFGILYSTAKLTECVNKASISGKGKYIAGLASDVSTGVELVRCGNEGKISNAGRQDYTAGLIGTTEPILLEECYNSGEVEISDLTYTVNVAGLIAYANYDRNAAAPMTLIGCYNTADITTYSVAAGLIAATNATSSVTNPIMMISCYNTGDISTVSQRKLKTPTAGLIAYYTPGSQLTDCWNSGNITSPNTYIGGIAGYYKQRPNENNPLKLINCHNTGLITANGGTGAGIIAYTYDYTTIENCHNNGNIEGGNTIGGIAGSFNGENSEILNCYNTGNVTTVEYNAGGLIGGGEYGKVNSCFNIGDIKTAKPEEPSESENGYAIGGLAGQGAAIFSNSYNLGTVTGENQTGGLIGVPVSEQTQVIRCYNMGAVSATEDSGALIGADLKDADLWSETNKVEGSYFTTALDANDNNTVGTATTVADLAKADMGEGWTSGDDYTLPIPTPFVANQYALINAVTVAFAEGDSEAAVTKDFFVGAPEGIAWTASVPNISFSGTNAMFSKDEFIGKATLTATAGELTRTFEISCDKKAGVGDIVEGKVIVKEVYYNTYGVEVPEPDGKDGNVYIVVRTYDDGTSETLKFFNVK